MNPTLVYTLNARLYRIRRLLQQRERLDRLIATEVEALETVCRQNGEDPVPWLVKGGVV